MHTRFGQARAEEHHGCPDLGKAEGCTHRLAGPVLCLNKVEDALPGWPGSCYG